MKATIRTKKGTERFDTEEALFSGGFLYKSLVAYFDEYINGYATQDTKDMYFTHFEELRGGTYLDWQGAIIEMYEVLCEHIEENKLNYFTTKLFYQIDFGGVLQE